MKAASEPLLESAFAEAPAPPPAHRRWLCLAIAGTFFLYVLLGALERITFVRMATAMPSGVLLMHTLLAVMSLLLFTVLQLARSQTSNQYTISAALLHLHMPDMVSMALLDVLHSLLALTGATVTSGITQAMLLQGAVPAITLFGALLVPPASKHGADGKAAVGQSVYTWLTHMINHCSPAECTCVMLRSPRAYQVLSAIAIAVIVVKILLSPLPGPEAQEQQQLMQHMQQQHHQQLMQQQHLIQHIQQQRQQQTDIQVQVAQVVQMAQMAFVGAAGSLSSATFAGEAQQQLGTTVGTPDPTGGGGVGVGGWNSGGGGGSGSGGGGGGVSGASGDVVVGTGPVPLAQGRLLFAGSTILSALTAAYKRRCLSRRPVDLLVLNTCLSALQLLAGLIVAPPLLLLLCAHPIKETLVNLARGLRCFMSGFR